MFIQTFLYVNFQGREKQIKSNFYMLLECPITCIIYLFISSHPFYYQSSCKVQIPVIKCLVRKFTRREETSHVLQENRGSAYLSSGSVLCRCLFIILSFFNVTLRFHQQDLETLVILHFASGHLCHYVNEQNKFHIGLRVDLSELLGNLCKFTKLMA